MAFNLVGVYNLSPDVAFRVPHDFMSGGLILECSSSKALGHDWYRAGWLTEVVTIDGVGECYGYDVAIPLRRAVIVFSPFQTPYQIELKPVPYLPLQVTIWESDNLYSMVIGP